jgi:hypothetical protein
MIISIKIRKSMTMAWDKVKGRRPDENILRLGEQIRGPARKQSPACGAEETKSNARDDELGRKLESSHEVAFPIMLDYPSG